MQFFHLCETFVYVYVVVVVVAVVVVTVEVVALPHMPLVQTLLTQSQLTEQALPSATLFLQVLPPVTHDSTTTAANKATIRIAT